MEAYDIDSDFCYVTISGIQMDLTTWYKLPISKRQKFFNIAKAYNESLNTLNNPKTGLK